MGRPIVYKILEDMLENSNLDSSVIEALQNDIVVSGMDRYDLYKQLGWFIEEYSEYVWGNKRKYTQEMEDMS